MRRVKRIGTSAACLLLSLSLLAACSPTQTGPDAVSDLGSGAGSSREESVDMGGSSSMGGASSDDSSSDGASSGDSASGNISSGGAASNDASSGGNHSGSSGGTSSSGTSSEQPPASTVDPPAAFKRGTPIVGEFLSCKVTSPSGAGKLVDNSGMSGLRAPNHLHNTNVNNSFSSTSPTPITFRFDSPQPIGYIYIWNYNAGGNQVNGMKDIRVEYSLDGRTWFTVGTGKYTLSKALPGENTQYGGNAANNQASGRNAIDMMGVPASYVRITPLSNYGGSQYGLSEVRFFRYKTRPGAGQMITSSATAPLAGSVPANLVNGWGMSDLGSAAATHSNDPSTMWYTASSDETMIVLDLDGTYPLDRLVFWNYNDPDRLNCGVRQVKIEYTTNEPYRFEDGKLDYQSGTWKQLGKFTLAQGDGSDSLHPSLTIPFDGLHAQHIRITLLSNYGGEGIGLSEVRAFAASGWAVEPSREWTGLFSNEGSFPYQISGQYGSGGKGWIGADGIYTLHINGSDMTGSANASSKTLFLFSDTLIGNFKGFSGTFGKYGLSMNQYGMVNHSMATLIGKEPDPRKIQFYLHSTDAYGNIIPRQDWAQELVRIGNKIYTWGIRYGKDWSASQYDLVCFDTRADGFPDFTQSPLVTDNTPTRTQVGDTTYEFGNCVLDNSASGSATPNPDGYIYIFGLRSSPGFLIQKYAIVARVKPADFTNHSQWRYWDGSGWVAEMTEAAPISDKPTISSEYSVSYVKSGQYRGKFMLVFTQDTMFSQLQFAVSDTLTGTYVTQGSDPIYYCDEVFSIYEACGDKAIYTYNAKAHPHLSADGELLISYNVNSQNFEANLSHEYLHPHFVKYFEIP